jgi:hypothetical protein
MVERKNPAAVSLGRRGGLASAAARMEKLSPEQRKEIARAAAQARWGGTTASKREAVGKMLAEARKKAKKGKSTKGKVA